LISEPTEPSDDLTKPNLSGENSDDVKKLDLPIKVLTALSKSGIVSVTHLRKLERKDLLELPGIGISACEKIVAALKKLK
jgi:DNA-directed RNA polymerase alpha subunit